MRVVGEARVSPKLKGSVRERLRPPDPAGFFRSSPFLCLGLSCQSLSSGLYFGKLTTAAGLRTIHPDYSLPGWVPSAGGA